MYLLFDKIKKLKANHAKAWGAKLKSLKFYFMDPPIKSGDNIGGIMTVSCQIGISIFFTEAVVN